MKKTKCYTKIIAFVLTFVLAFAFPTIGASALDSVTISMESTTISAGDPLNIACSNTASKDWICIYPADFTNKYKYYDYLYANTNGVSFPSGQTSRYGFGADKWPLAAGEYVAVLYANDGYSEIMRLPFTVEESVNKTATLDKTTYTKGDDIVITTSNWVADDHDFIRVYKTPVTDYSTFVAQTYGDWGRSEYYINTSSWEPGEYRLIAFDKGDFNSEFIADVTFTVNDNASAKGITTEKTSYEQGETIVVNTKNWVAADQDFIRAYKKPVTSYNTYVGNTYGNWGRSSYSFDTIDWTPGDYVIKAFKNSGWVLIEEINITITEPSTPIVRKTATLDKEAYVIGDTIIVTTTNWVEADHDFIRIYKNPVTNYGQGFVAQTYNDWGKTTYTFDTTGWVAGQYSLKAFDKGNFNNLIADINFNLTETGAEPVRKTATLNKERFYKNEEIVVTTQNWVASDHDFIRIYKVPVTNYNEGFVAQTYNNWGRSTYSFYPSNWETGTYRLIAFDKGNFNTEFIADVTFTVEDVPEAPESQYYSNDGTVITLKQDYTIDFSKVKHSEEEGKLFVGWTDEDGEPVANNTLFEADTVLLASYIDCNVTTAFGFVGSEVRATENPALRFIFKKSNELTNGLPEDLEYGAIVIPSSILDGANWAELVYDGQYEYNGNTYTAAKIAADNMYSASEDISNYTVTVTGITEAKFMRLYTARGYIKYTDINGMSQIIYTDSVSTSLYNAAKADLNKTSIYKVQGERLNSIIDTANVAQLQKYNSLDKVTIHGTSDNLDTWMYTLGNNGIAVKEAVFDSGKGGKPVVINQLSDLHYNYINDEDRSEGNPTVLSTAAGREWGGNGSFAVKSRGVVDYAMTADQVVVTGDVLDYLSNGTVDLMFRELWNKIPNALIALGNHEYVQQMQGTVPESLSLAERYQKLENVWKHDIYYSSKVIDEKAMVIQLHNGERKFYESQIAPLTRDINLARENGYVVLLFMHETLATNNPAETAVNAIHINDAGWATNEDFCNNSKNHHIGGSGMDAATTSVYNLITNNADVIKGVFNGHIHSTFYTEIIAKTADGANAVIPQYTMTGSSYDNGHVTKITIR